MNTTAAKFLSFFCPFALILLLTTVGCSDMQEKAEKTSPNALWWVTNSCTSNEKITHMAVPCEQVNLDKGYVLLKDLRGKTQFLLIPTTRIGGIESPEILAPDAINYWQPAWDARTYVSARAPRPLPDNDIGLAVNSFYGRTQNQLHIHIDCVKPEVIAALKKSRNQPSGKWFKINFPELHTYQARYMTSLKADPFKLVKEDEAHMERKTVVITHAGNRFVMLVHAATFKNDDRGSGEELLDHTCSVAK